MYTHIWDKLVCWKWKTLQAMAGQEAASHSQSHFQVLRWHYALTASKYHKGYTRQHTLSCPNGRQLFLVNDICTANTFGHLPMSSLCLHTLLEFQQIFGSNYSGIHASTITCVPQLSGTTLIIVVSITAWKLHVRTDNQTSSLITFCKCSGIVSTNVSLPYI